MRRMFESQHTVQYGYRLLHPTKGVLWISQQIDFKKIP
jgi:hypothetical protein